MPPFAEKTIVHGGKQSMPFEYNNVSTPYYSEGERDLEHGSGLDRQRRRHADAVLPGQSGSASSSPPPAASP